MPNVSYAQNREDVLLNRVFPGAVGFYIDVGAADPVELSVTKWFYDRGWSGINVEPQDGYFAALCAVRPRDINLNALMSDARSEVMFYEVPERPLLSTPDPDTAEHLRRGGDTVVARTVQALTLAEVCDRYVRGPIDFLKIDVEGHELAVLRGADFTRWRPIVMLIEATESESPTPNHGAWEPLVLATGYQFATFDGLNRYYVRSEDAHLIPKLQVPINLFDGYYETYDRVQERTAWGIEATRQAEAVAADRARERAAWDAERAAWGAERATWKTERAALLARIEEQKAEQSESVDRARWLEGQLRLYRAA